MRFGVRLGRVKDVEGEEWHVTKQEFVERVAAKTNLTKADAGRAGGAVLGAVPAGRPGGRVAPRGRPRPKVGAAPPAQARPPAPGARPPPPPKKEGAPRGRPLVV